MLMSRGALLGAVAMANAIADADWPVEGRLETAAFMGVGASGGEIPQLERILKASMGDDGFTEQRLCRRGVRACSPLFTFQLMNNFTLCHGAILEGIGGENGAFYSRGVGTVRALREAWWALEEGDAAQALVGGADDALYPVTSDELIRQGADEAMLGAGAGVLALTGQSSSAGMATVSACEVWDDWPAVRMVEAKLRGAGAWDHVVVAAAHSAAEKCDALVRALAPNTPSSSMGAHFGEVLAAGPALAWVFATSLIVGGRARRVGVVTAGLDGGLGVTVLSR